MLSIWTGTFTACADTISASEILLGEKISKINIENFDMADSTSKLPTLHHHAESLISLGGQTLGAGTLVCVCVTT
jgi:hypothetical protein